MTKPAYATEAYYKGAELANEINIFADRFDRAHARRRTGNLRVTSIGKDKSFGAVQLTADVPLTRTDIRDLHNRPSLTIVHELVSKAMDLPQAILRPTQQQLAAEKGTIPPVLFSFYSERKRTLSDPATAQVNSVKKLYWHPMAAGISTGADGSVRQHSDPFTGLDFESNVENDGEYEEAVSKFAEFVGGGILAASKLQVDMEVETRAPMVRGSYDDMFGRSVRGVRFVSEVSEGPLLYQSAHDRYEPGTYVRQLCRPDRARSPFEEEVHVQGLRVHWISQSVSFAGHEQPAPELPNGIVQFMNTLHAVGNEL